MGKVIVRYRILPDAPENFQRLRKSLESLSPDKMDEDPIAFGLKAIIFTKLVDDRSGAEEELEARVKALPHAETVETISVTRGL